MLRNVWWAGEAWELIPYEELENIRDEDVLMQSDFLPRNMHIARITHKDGDYFMYKEKVRGIVQMCFVPTMWYGNSFRGIFMPFRRVRSKDPTLCYCSGPAMSRFCFDTQKVETLCCRCKKRKRQ